MIDKEMCRKIVAELKKRKEEEIIILEKIGLSSFTEERLESARKEFSTPMTSPLIGCLINILKREICFEGGNINSLIKATEMLLDFFSD